MAEPSTPSAPVAIGPLPAEDATRRQERLDRLLVQRESSILDAMAAIDRGGIGACVAVDADRRLIATITDGDVRRAILTGIDLKGTLSTLLTMRGNTATFPVIAASVGSSRLALMELMERHTIRLIPLHDADYRVVDVATLQDLALGHAVSPRALIMAGGFGKRLGELTKKTPKPMLKVGGVPMLERIVQQLRANGFLDVNISIGYLGDQIVEHFGDGRAHGVAITYIRETKPLGTAGAIGLLTASDRPLLVMNGDLLTTVNLKALHQFHDDSGAWLTMGVRAFEQQVPFGVVECDGLEVRGIIEKPKSRHLISAGIYMMKPAACALAPKGQRLDMPELAQILLANHHRVAAFPIQEDWLDIGCPDDFDRANDQASSLRLVE